MTPPMTPLRIVLDTSIVVSALLFRNGALSWVRLAWQAMDFVPITSSDTISELRRVINYPKFRLNPGGQSAVMRQYLPWCETVPVAAPTELPECRDPGDIKFLELALSAQADALVTGDKRDLLVLQPVFPIPIISAAELRSRLPDAQQGETPKL